MSSQIKTPAKATPWWKYPIAEFCFWFISIFGGSVVLLINAIQPRLGRYEKGDLGYLILQLISTPVGVVLAVIATDRILEKRHKIFCIVNCTIGATLYSVIVAINLLSGSVNYFDLISIALAVAAYIYMAIALFKQTRSKSPVIAPANDAEPDYTKIVSETASSDFVSVKEPLVFAQQEDAVNNDLGDRKTHSKKRFTIVALSFLCFSLSAASVILYIDHRKSVATYEARISELTATVENFKSTVADLREDYLSRSVEYIHLSAVANKIGFIVDGSQEYHTYNCSIAKNAERYEIHNINYCKYLGYEAHSCWSDMNK